MYPRSVVSIIYLLQFICEKVHYSLYLGDGYIEQKNALCNKIHAHLLPRLLSNIIHFVDEASNEHITPLLQKLTKVHYYYIINEGYIIKIKENCKIATKPTDKLYTVGNHAHTESNARNIIISI